MTAANFQFKLHDKRWQSDRAQNRIAPDNVPKDILSHLRTEFDRRGWQIEHLHAVFLDSNRLYIADRAMGSGDLDKLTMRLRPLFGLAIGLGASGLILAHNHPSGDCRPSAGDFSATKRMASVAKALDIELLDHLILTSKRAYSMRRGAML